MFSFPSYMILVRLLVSLSLSCCMHECQCIHKLEQKNLVADTEEECLFIVKYFRMYLETVKLFWGYVLGLNLNSQNYVTLLQVQAEIDKYVFIYLYALLKFKKTLLVVNEERTKKWMNEPSQSVYIFRDIIIWCNK